MLRLKSTKDWGDWWRTRTMDWDKDYTATWNHPHRFLISGILKTFDWISLFEIGCGSGANLINIFKCFEGKTIQLGGQDIVPEAIAAGKKVLPGAILKIGPGNDVMMSDDSADVILTDMCLIYIDPTKIHSYLKEIKRIGRRYVLLCELHSESFYGRVKLWYNSGYYAHNYIKLLRRHGFYDITLYKIPEAGWPGGEPQKTFGFIIKAKIPPRK